MKNIMNNKVVSYSFKNKHQHANLLKLGRALNSKDRLLVLSYIWEKSANMLELSKALDLPISSVTKHIDILADAGLINIKYEPGKKGHTKVCSPGAYEILLDFDCFKKPAEFINIYSFEYEMPIGCFTDCKVIAPCGMASTNDHLVKFDHPNYMFRTSRINAGIIWFQQGLLKYSFANEHKGRSFNEIEFSLEICSESDFSRRYWLSDVTFSINNIETATITLPGDFNDRKGKLTPNYWSINNSQYGLLKLITVNNDGVFLDKKKIRSNLTINDLNLTEIDNIDFTIEIKDNANHIGGINIFGKDFGDHPQDILMRVKILDV